MTKRIGILTGGGDVQALNAVVASAQSAVQALHIDLVGIINGWKGALEANYVDLATQSVNPRIGGTIEPQIRHPNLGIVGSNGCDPKKGT